MSSTDAYSQCILLTVLISKKHPTITRGYLADKVENRGSGKKYDMEDFTAQRLQAERFYG